jgi:ApaG protein
MYQSVTQEIMVSVEPIYLDGQSVPDQSRYVWAYRVTIENQSPRTVQLQSRYWRITDQNGRVEEVRGPGVVGEQPILNPGDSYTYSSGCPLTTPSGTMVGRYQMRGDDGRQFEIDIPAFSLDIPGEKRVLN